MKSVPAALTQLQRAGRDSVFSRVRKTFHSSLGLTSVETHSYTEDIHH